MQKQEQENMSKDMDFYYSQEISPINIAKIIGYWYKNKT